MRVSWWTAVILAAACAPPGGSTAAPPEPRVYSTPVVLVVSPDSQEVQALRNELGEDFYVVADDAMWYRAATYQMLDSLRIPYAPVGRGQARFRVRGRPRLFDWSQRKEAWFLVLYNGEDEPVISADIDLEAALGTFRNGAARAPHRAAPAP